jgi:DNA repair protein RecO (recombination protein O)
MYVNELISKLTPSDNLNLCSDYLYLLNNLNTDKNNNLWQLRLFENEFLEQIGYGVDFENDVNDLVINSNYNYNFILNGGFIPVKIGNSGDDILKIAKKIMPSEQGLYFCKKINRERISFLMQGRELKSRKLFRVK